MGLLSALGGMIGLAVGGPLGAALGSGIGSLAGGGDIGDALKAGVLGFGIGAIPGAQGFAQSAVGAAGLQGLAGGGAGAGAGGPLAGLFGGGGAGGMAAAGAGGGAKAAVNPLAALTGGGSAGAAANLGGGIMGFAQQNPLIMAALMQAAEPSQNMLSPEQERQLATGERLPDYRGTAAVDPRRMGVRPRSQNFAMGGYIEGPGTGTSDSIPAMIYQNGGPVQEAMLSDGEFVMTERAVRGAGNGDRNAGAAKMYEMMNRFERRA